MELVKENVIGFVIGMLLTSTVFLVAVLPKLKAKDMSISDELVRIESRVDIHEQALKEIISFLNQASQPK